MTKEPATPIPSASVIVLRGEPFEVLMMLRHQRSSFVPGFWVFPGGAVDACDRTMTASELDAMKACAIRELFEETGIWIGEPMTDPEATRARLLQREIAFEDVAPRPLLLDRLAWTSRWITPVAVPKRFDTYFFLAEVPADTEAVPELNEGVEMRWLRPEVALEEQRRGSFPLVFPTIKNLEALAPFRSAKALIESRQGAVITPVQPVMILEGEKGRIVLPDET